jgi:hypothetical protein
MHGTGCTGYARRMQHTDARGMYAVRSTGCTGGCTRAALFYVPLHATCARALHPGCTLTGGCVRLVCNPTAPRTHGLLRLRYCRTGAAPGMHAYGRVCTACLHSVCTRYARSLSWRHCRTRAARGMHAYGQVCTLPLAGRLHQGRTYRIS